MIFGFLGPNASGKTTTIHLLLGLLEPTSGKATVLGFDTLTQADQVRCRSGALLEHTGLYEQINAEDNLDFYGRVWHMPPAERQARMKELLTHFGLWERRPEHVDKWSRGMKQKLAMARADHVSPTSFFSCARQGAITWGCKSPTGLIGGTVSRTARVSIARWNLKEAAGKALARRTGTAYEAAMLGERANRLKARILSGKHGRRCGGHKCEGERALPGEVCQSAVMLPASRGVGMGWQKSAEGIVGPSTGPKARTCVVVRRPSFR